MKTTFKIFAIVALLLAAALGGSRLIVPAQAAPTSDIAGQPFNVITVSTSAVTTVSLTQHDYMIAHVGYQSDGTTASVAGDYIVVMNASDTMAASLADGKKLPIFAGGSATFRGWDCSYIAADNAIEVQLKAVGHSAKVLVLKGNLNGSQK